MTQHATARRRIAGGAAAALTLVGLLAGCSSHPGAAAVVDGRTITSAELVTVVDELKPAVPVRKSIAADYLICLEDGKKFKSLKRHLRTHYDLSPEEYREKWGLPADYPMVAPNYSATRSRLAKDNGLGRKAGK